MIQEFNGDFRWLSNFYSIKIPFRGLIYSSVEHACQQKVTHLHGNYFV